MSVRLPIGLYVNEAELPALRQKTRTGYPARMVEVLLGMCDELLETFEPEAGFDEMEVKRTTKDLACWEPHLGYVRRNADVIQKLGLAYLLTDDPRYADLGKRTMLVQARHGEWHQYYRTHGTIECGEVCKGMATGYDWLYDVLSRSERRIVEQAMAEKGGADLAGSLTGTGEGMKPEDGERYSRNNFGLVMTGGLGLIGLALDGRHEQAPEWLQLAHTYMEKSIRRQYGVDGGIVEAARYWNYSTPFCLFLMDPLHRLRGVDLFAIDSFSKTAEFPVYYHSATTEGPRGVANFADTTFGEPAIHGCVLLKFASHYRRGDCRHFWERWFRTDLWAGHHHDLVHSILWYDPDVEPKAPELDLVKRFRTLEWVFIRDTWEPNGTQFVFKSGPFLHGHNHRDRNSFILEAFGERLALDAGSGPYYTDIQRDYYTQSIGHNVLLIDGKGQTTGGAEITEYEVSDGVCYLASDASAVYPQADSVVRELLAADGRVFVVRDRVRCARPPRIDWLLHTFASVSRAGHFLICRSEKADLFVAVGEPSEWESAVRPGHVDGKENACNTLTIGAQAKGNEAVVTVLLLPVAGDARSPEIAWDQGVAEVRTEARTYRISCSHDRIRLDERVDTKGLAAE